MSFFFPYRNFEHTWNGAPIYQYIYLVWFLVIEHLFKTSTYKKLLTICIATCQVRNEILITYYFAYPCCKLLWTSFQSLLISLFSGLTKVVTIIVLAKKDFFSRIFQLTHKFMFWSYFSFILKSQRSYCKEKKSYFCQCNKRIVNHFNESDIYDECPRGGGNIRLTCYRILYWRQISHPGLDHQCSLKPFCYTTKRLS